MAEMDRDHILNALRKQGIEVTPAIEQYVDGFKKAADEFVFVKFDTSSEKTVGVEIHSIAEFEAVFGGKTDHMENMRAGFRAVERESFRASELMRQMMEAADMQFNAILPEGYAVSNGLWVIHPDDSYRLGTHVVGITEAREIVTLEFEGDPWAAVDAMIDDDAEPVTITNGIKIMAYKPTINGEVTEDSQWTSISIPIPDEYKEI